MNSTYSAFTTLARQVFKADEMNHTQCGQMVTEFSHEKYLEFDTANQTVFLRPEVDDESGFFDNSTITYRIEGHATLTFSVTIESTID